jgi:DNA-binding CsgD family transcriptional regulator
MPDQALAALERLVQRGFAYQLSDGHEPAVRFAAAPPETITRAITSRLMELHRAQESIGKIASRYRARQRALDGGEIFEVIRGADELSRRTRGLMRAARLEVLNMVKPPIIAMASRERVLPEAAVRGRVIYQTAALDAPGALDAISDSLREQDEIRVHTKLPVKMLAIDREVALIPAAQQDTTPVGVLIHESAMLDSLLSLFDYVWATAVPLHMENENQSHPAGSHALSPQDRHLLSLLLSGLTDDAIGAHMRISERTVQRRVRSLMESANVRTRMQLAWEAARHGWV